MWARGLRPGVLAATDIKVAATVNAPSWNTQSSRKQQMGQFVDEIITLIALGDNRHPAARGETLAAFDERGIPGGCVAPPSNTAGILSRRALPAAGAPAARAVRSGVEGRLARLGATPEFQNGLPGTK
jgi:hypothetical protein